MSGRRSSSGPAEAYRPRADESCLGRKFPTTGVPSIATPGNGPYTRVDEARHLRWHVRTAEAVAVLKDVITEVILPEATAEPKPTDGTNVGVDVRSQVTTSAMAEDEESSHQTN